MEITSGIHQISGVKGANCYLVISESKMLLIDTGLPGNERKIIHYIRGLGKNPADINYVILTHADIDHIGSAAAVKKMTAAKLAIHAEDAPILSGQGRFKTVRGFRGVIFKLMTPLMHYQAVEPDVILKDNSEIDGFRVIHTPGHTKGSISLYLPGKVIFVGDALRSVAKGNLRFPSSNFSADFAQAKASLRALSNLEFDILLPGHGSPVIGQGPAKLKKLVEQIE